MQNAGMIANSRISAGFWTPTRKADETRGDGGAKMIRRTNRRREVRLFRKEVAEILASR